MTTNDAVLSNIADILNKGGWLLRGGKEARYAYPQSANLRNWFFREHTFVVVEAEVSGTALVLTVGIARNGSSLQIAEGTRNIFGRPLVRPALSATPPSLIELTALYPEMQTVSKRDGGGTRTIEKALLALRFECPAIAYGERSQIPSPETPDALADDECCFRPHAHDADSDHVERAGTAA